MFDIHKKILSNVPLLGIVLKSLWKALKLSKISLYSSLYKINSSFFSLFPRCKLITLLKVLNLLCFLLFFRGRAIVYNSILSEKDRRKIVHSVISCRHHLSVLYFSVKGSIFLLLLPCPFSPFLCTSTESEDL